MDWTKSLTLCTKSKNHLRILEQVYDNPKTIKQIKSVNQKTSYRILNYYVKEGIISKEKEAYYLTNKGRLISYLVLGKFESIKPDITNKVIVESKEVYIEREDVIKQILYNIERKKHTIILGESGIGKTSLLKHLQKEYLKDSVYTEVKPIKYVLEKLGKHLNLEFKKSIRTNELINLIRKEKPTLTLLIDNLELSTTQCSRIIKELQRCGITILGAGQYVKQAISFDEKIKLRTLTNQEVNQLVTALLSQEFDNLEEINQLIIQNTNNNPEQVTRICEQTKILKEHDEEHEIRKHVKPTNKRINLLDTNSLVSLGYLMITLRYVFYGRKEYQIGYILSTIAYFLFFMFRRRKKKTTN